MKVCAFQLRPHLLRNHGHKLQSPQELLTAISSTTTLKMKPSPPRNIKLARGRTHERITEKELLMKDSSDEVPRWLLLGGLSFGLASLLLWFDGQQEALALGPEGPLVEEFWDNVRRYGLYIITVSTGAIYTILQPIFELLKNPITAVLIIIVLLGSFYLLSQVLSAMFGISEYSYQYGY